MRLSTFKNVVFSLQDSNFLSLSPTFFHWTLFSTVLVLVQMAETAVFFIADVLVLDLVLVLVLVLLIVDFDDVVVVVDKMSGKEIMG